MTFAFDPHQTRAALKNIAAAFPIEREKEPAGITTLFQILEQMDLAGVGHWCAFLSSRDLDLMCRFFFRSRNPRVILALVVVLAHLKDRRFIQVIRFFFLLYPDKGQIRELKRFWQILHMEDLLAGITYWIGKYMEGEEQGDLLRFVLGELQAGTVTLNDLETDFSLDLPLLEQLVHILFKRGGSLVTGLNPETAARLAMTFLEQGRDPELRTYLHHYPKEYWKPGFMDALYDKKGPPNPRIHPFYAQLEKGCLWIVRQKLFQPRMEAMSGFRLEFWERWLHRCYDCRWIQGTAHLFIHPFKIVEESDRSLVFALGDAIKPIEIIEYDILWSQKMEALLSEHIQWGYHA